MPADYDIASDTHNIGDEKVHSTVLYKKMSSIVNVPPLARFFTSANQLHVAASGGDMSYTGVYRY